MCPKFFSSGFSCVLAFKHIYVGTKKVWMHHKKIVSVR
jgi:hypothetical protein